MKTKFLLRTAIFIVFLTVCCGALLSCAGTDAETVNIGTVRTDGAIVFSADDDAAAAAGSHYVLIAGKREIQIFNEKGKRVYYKQTQLNNPKVLANGSCFLVYDKNSSSCYLFRNDNCLAELQPDYPIYAACLDSSGSFALAVGAYASASAVHWYDASGKLKGTVERSDYTVDCALTAGGRLILLTLDADGGEWVTAVSSYKIGSSAPVCVYEKTFRDVYPYQCSIKGNRVAAVCSGGVYLLDKKGKTTIVDVGDVSSYSVVLQSNGRTVLIDDQSVVTVDAGGKKTVFTLPIGSVEHAAAYGDTLFLTQSRTIVKMNLKKGSAVTGTAQIDFDNIVSKSTAGQIYLRTAASLVPYKTEE